MLEKAFIGTIDLEFIQKKKIFCNIINDDKWLSLKSNYQKFKKILKGSHMMF